MRGAPDGLVPWEQALQRRRGDGAALMGAVCGAGGLDVEGVRPGPDEGQWHQGGGSMDPAEG
jgi:hypothetical protein